ncbi:MAG: ABC transporter substrate-binding protein [Lacisediminihabitans sp.]
MRPVKRFFGIAAAVTISAMALAGCSDGGTTVNGGSGGTVPSVLSIMANTVPSYQRNFNPFSPSVNLGTVGFVYEPLILNSPAQAQGIPWLATALAWSNGGRTATFTIRDGVKWSDGKPFTAEDVAFSFNLLVTSPATNITALPISNATASGNTVTVNLSQVGYAYEQALGNFTPVPKHLWASQDATKWTNPTPIGTGPYTLGAFSTQLVTYAKSKSYWQADKIKVDKIEYPVATPETFVSNLGAGKYDWAGGFVPNIDKLFVNKDPKHNKYWFPGDSLTNLVMNVQKAPFNDVNLRKAISLAVDRNELAKVAELGYVPIANPTGLVLPAMQSYMDPQYANAKFTYNVSEANSILDSAGYTKGPDGIRVSPDGKKLSFDITIPSGYTDWVTMAKLLQTQLQKVGIQANPQGVSSTSWSNELHAGTFQMSFYYPGIGTGPYDLYRSFMSKELSAPAGQSATLNYGRWEDPQTEKYLAAYGNTGDKAAQKAAIQGLEGIVVNQLPSIPLLQGANWDEYRTANFTGWPDAQNPYALGAPYQFPDNLLVITHLTPVKK